ncbi:hypothetical protein [Geodermatophilus sp. DF01-2]|uniref:hypothetical protein n=1 Tax=Geodermatophilus sp. DF01-2 TaxID=2559610 RepID=UPI001431A590|nr:hypothetical protein [Geodermatophilus sp. DF01_2]
MEQDPRDPSGDYGYDLAHEATGTAEPAAPPGPTGTPPPPAPDDAAEDLGYDEAHDF